MESSVFRHDGDRRNMLLKIHIDVSDFNFAVKLLLSCEGAQNCFEFSKKLNTIEPKRWETENISVEV